MKITGAKKLSIILLSLGCSVAAGLGVLFSGAFSTAPVSYAQTAPHALIGEEEDVLAEFSQMSGISERDIKFYANSNGLSVEAFYQYYLHDKTTAENEIMQFLNGYAQGKYTRQDDISNEDWYLDPDEVGTYTVWTGDTVGIADTLTDFYTSKSFITTEKFYWRESGFQWGHMERWGINYSSFMNKNETQVSTLQGTYYDSFWIWDIVWLEEGEQYDFGVYSDKRFLGKNWGALSAPNFIDTYLSRKPYSAYRYTYNSYVSGMYNWSVFGDSTDNVSPASDADLATFFEPASVTTHGTRGDYKDEFGSNIVPEWQYMTWATDLGSRGANDFSKGWHIMHLSKDAPSGVYYMQFSRPVISRTTKNVWRAGMTGTSYNSGRSISDQYWESPKWKGDCGWSENRC